MNSYFYVFFGTEVPFRESDSVPNKTKEERAVEALEWMISAIKDHGVSIKEERGLESDGSGYQYHLRFDGDYENLKEGTP